MVDANRSSMPRCEVDGPEGSREAGQKKARAGRWISVGAGCAALLGLALCSGGAIGIWIWQKPAQGQVANKPPDDAGGGIQANNPIKGAAPLGKVPRTELDPAVPIWDFSIRVPKGLEMTAENQKTADVPNLMFFYQWSPTPASGRTQLNINKWPSTEANPLLRLVSGKQKFKSGPGDPLQFDTIHMPQSIDINGLTGARSWTLFSNKQHGLIEIDVVYYFLVDGWGYHFNGLCFGIDEAEARQNAERVDVSICTFRKR
jgi:hypothetical protein